MYERKLKEQIVRDMTLSILTGRLNLNSKQVEEVFGGILDKLTAEDVVEKIKDLATASSIKECLQILKHKS